MKPSDLTLLVWGGVVFLFGLVSDQTGGLKARPTAPSDSPAVRTAPAVSANAAEDLRRQLLARLEFEELSLKLVGVATFDQTPACYLVYPGAQSQMQYRIGDVVGGYRIASIQDKSVCFQRGSAQFWLNLGECSDGTMPEQLQSADGIESEDSVEDSAVLTVQAPAAEIKSAEKGLKRKKGKFETAKIIEDATKVVASARRRAADRGIPGEGFLLPMRGYLSSEFGFRRDPFGGQRKFHKGVDISAPYGTPVLAASDGVVTRALQASTSYGRHIIIRHENGYETVYGHLSKILVQPGQKVTRGMVIGREGNTGRSTGPHLHFEIRKNGSAIDPTAYVKVRH